MKSRGLGDSIEKVTQATGIKTLAEIASTAMGYQDCGCDSRKAWLNKQFPYKND
jgi:hypothetical protein